MTSSLSTREGGRRRSSSAERRQQHSISFFIIFVLLILIPPSCRAKLSLESWLYGGPSYDSRQAKFGAKLKPDIQYRAHFVLPPQHDPYLCGNQTWMNTYPPPPPQQQPSLMDADVRPMAVLAPAGECSAQTKAWTVMKEVNAYGYIHGEGQIQMVIIYNENPSDLLLRYEPEQEAEWIDLNVQSITFESGMDLLWKINDTAQRLGDANPYIHWDEEKDDGQQQQQQQQPRKWSFPVYFEKARLTKTIASPSSETNDFSNNENNSEEADSDNSDQITLPDENGNAKKNESSGLDTTKTVSTPSDSNTQRQPNNNFPSLSPGSDHGRPFTEDTSTSSEKNINSSNNNNNRIDYGDEGNGWDFIPWLTILAKVTLLSLIVMTLLQFTIIWYGRGGRILLVRRPDGSRFPWALQIIRPLSRQSSSELSAGGSDAEKLTVEQVLLLPQVEFVPGQPQQNDTDASTDDHINNQEEVIDLECGLPKPCVTDDIEEKDINIGGKDEEEDITVSLFSKLTPLEKHTSPPSRSPSSVSTDETADRDDDDDDLDDNDDNDSHNTNQDLSGDNVTDESIENGGGSINDDDNNSDDGPSSMVTVLSGKKNGDDDEQSSSASDVDNKSMLQINRTSPESTKIIKTTITSCKNNDNPMENILPLTQWNGCTILSTTCSICIDEFQRGEIIRVLPRCRHAFHTDCILPWLVDRQGCCPTCKTPVLNDNDQVIEEQEQPLEQEQSLEQELEQQQEQEQEQQQQQQEQQQHQEQEQEQQQQQEQATP